MAKSSLMSTLAIIAEILIVFTGSIGVIGMIQDYYWFSNPDIITAEKVLLKYYGGVFAAISQGGLILRRRHIQKKSNLM